MVLKYKILDMNQGKSKDGKIYHKVSLYANWSSIILDCFVTEEVYNMISDGIITDENISEYLSFKIINGKVYLSINIK